MTYLICVYFYIEHGLFYFENYNDVLGKFLILRRFILTRYCLPYFLHQLCLLVNGESIKFHTLFLTTIGFIFSFII